MIYVPGDLFSVNHLTAQNVPNLFARNERVICLFDTEFGPMAQILVGATIVGSIETVWEPLPRRAKASSSAGRPEGEHEGSVALLKGRRWGALNWVPRSSTYLRRESESDRVAGKPVRYQNWPTAGDVDRNIRRAGGRTCSAAGRRN